MVSLGSYWPCPPYESLQTGSALNTDGDQSNLLTAWHCTDTVIQNVVSYLGSFQTCLSFLPWLPQMALKDRILKTFQPDSVSLSDTHKTPEKLNKVKLFLSIQRIHMKTITHKPFGLEVQVVRALLVLLEVPEEIFI